MRLLLAIDGSNGSDLALDSILASRWPEGSTIHVISVAEPVNKHLDAVSLGIGVMAESAQRALENDLQEMLDEGVAKLKEVFGEGKATCELLRGKAEEEILKAARDLDASQLIVGSQGTSGAASASFGGVAVTLASKAPCTVSVISNLSEQTLEKAGDKRAVPRRFLLAINQSENSRSLMDLISSRPWPEDSSFQVLSVVPEVKRAERSRMFKATAIAETEEKVQIAYKDSAEALVKEATQKLKDCTPESKVTGHVLIGSPRNLILQVAQDWPADMIIIGAHDHKDSMFGYLAGSTASAVVAHAECSVMVVRPKS